MVWRCEVPMKRADQTGCASYNRENWPWVWLVRSATVHGNQAKGPTERTAG